MSSNPKQENKSSLGYAFKQQVMKAWQPVPTLNSTICLFLVLSLFFLIIGIVLISYSEMVRENSQRYDVLCLGDSVCTVEIALDESFQQPVYLYYELSNFYQNHRRYVKSKSTDQLSGSYPGTTTDCDPVITNEQMGQTLSYAGIKLDPKATASPCGLIAKSLFNDTFVLEYRSGEGTLTPIKINQTQIAWPSDRDGRYKNSGDSTKTQWIDMEKNEHWMVWMRTAALPTFRKLWGRIMEDLPAGKYRYTIQNNYDVSKFDGSKTLVISTANAFGGKNTFLAVSYIVVGVICALVTIGFFVRKVLSNQDNKNKVG